MALVGDIIINTRELVPDMPGKLSAPSLPNSVVTISAQSPSGSEVGWPNSLNIFKISVLTPWGESEISTVTISTSITAGQVASIDALNLPVGASAIRLYPSTDGTTFNFYFNVSATGHLSYSAAQAGSPQSISRAWLPDTAGSFVSAKAIFRWLNEGLNRAAKLVGGIQDITGVQALLNTAQYTLQGQWLNLQSAWFDGLPVALNARQDVYRKSAISSIVSMITLLQGNNNQIIEVWPQPSRAGGTTTLTSGIGATDSTLPVTSIVNFQPLGLCQIESEIIKYSTIVGNSLVGCQRGLGGTTAAAHLNGTTVTELNIQMFGTRMPELYNVGDSLKTLTVPPSWETLLPLYLLHKFKLAEQSTQEAQGLLQQFEGELKEVARSNRQLAGPLQIGGPNSGTSDLIGGTSFGRWFLP